MPTMSDSLPAGARTSHHTTDKRLDDLAWGLFLVMTGGLWLLPQDRVPSGAWLLGTGLILLALNAIRYFTGRAVSVFTLLLGVLAFVGGIAEFSGLSLPLFALCVVVVGAGIMLRAAFSSRT